LVCISTGFSSLDISIRYISVSFGASVSFSSVIGLSSVSISITGCIIIGSSFLEIIIGCVSIFEMVTSFSLTITIGSLFGLEIIIGFATVFSTFMGLTSFLTIEAIGFLTSTFSMCFSSELFFPFFFSFSY
jgi:hypothetical protein